MSEFVVLRGRELITVSNYEDIPENFDNVIKFLPDISDGPHSQDEHDEISFWNDKLKQLMKREKNARSN